MSAGAVDPCIVTLMPIRWQLLSRGSGRGRGREGEEKGRGVILCYAWEVPKHFIQRVEETSSSAAVLTPSLCAVSGGRLSAGLQEALQTHHTPSKSRRGGRGRGPQAFQMPTLPGGLHVAQHAAEAPQVSQRFGLS